MLNKLGIRSENEALPDFEGAVPSNIRFEFNFESSQSDPDCSFWWSTQKFRYRPPERLISVGFVQSIREMLLPEQGPAKSPRAWNHFNFCCYGKSSKPNRKIWLSSTEEWPVMSCMNLSAVASCRVSLFPDARLRPGWVAEDEEGDKSHIQFRKWWV